MFKEEYANDWKHTASSDKNSARIKKLVVWRKINVTTDTNNHSSFMIKHILPYNFNICYRIYLKLAELNGIGMPDKIMIN